MHRRVYGPAACLATAVLAALPLATHAQQATGWRGKNTSANAFDWTNSDNWDNGTPGGNIRDLYFGDTYASVGGYINTPYNNLASYDGYRITFESGANTGFTLNGNAVTLFDYGGNAPQIVNNSANYTQGFGTMNVTLNSSVGSSSISANSGTLSFGNAHTLTVAGSNNPGVRLYGTGTTLFNGTVNAADKYFATAGTGTNTSIGGSFTAANFFVMNNATLSLTASNSGIANVVLGTDYGATGALDSTKSGVLKLNNTAGGVSFGGTVTTGSSNSSGTLAIESNSGAGTTNTLTNTIYMADANLRVAQTGAGTLRLTSGGSIALGSRQLTFESAGRIEVARAITNNINFGSPGAVIIGGSGVTQFSGANQYRGNTTVNSGATLLLDNTSGSATGVNTGSNTLFVNGTLAGTGSTDTPVSLSATGTISAGSGTARRTAPNAATGDTIGTLKTGTQSWTGGGTAVIKVNGTSGVAGTNFDLLNIVGKLDLAGVSSGSKFNLVLTYAKEAAAFTPAVGQTFRIAATSTGIYNGASAYGNNVDLTSLFVLNTSDVGLNTVGFSVFTAGTGGGQAQDLMITYTAAPEPTAAVLAGLGGAAVLGRRRGRRA